MITSGECQAKRGFVGRAVLGVAHMYFEPDVAPFEYHNDPEKTAASGHPAHDNWCTVSNLGYLHDDRYLFPTDHVRDRIAHYKAPKSVDFVDELPGSATGSCSNATSLTVTQEKIIERQMSESAGKRYAVTGAASKEETPIDD
jgi:hypothetical protein